MGFLKSPEIPLEVNFFRFPREEEKTRTRAVGFLKTPEIPLEGNFFRFPREAEKSRTKAVRFLKSTKLPLEGFIFHPLHVADWPRVQLCHYTSFHTRTKTYNIKSRAHQMFRYDVCMLIFRRKRTEISSRGTSSQRKLTV